MSEEVPMTPSQAIDFYEVQASQYKAKQAQVELYLTQMKARPSYYTPCAMRRDGSRWVCILETSENPLECVMAYGDSPEKAAANFDHLWWGTGLEIDSDGEIVGPNEEEEEDDEGWLNTEDWWDSSGSDSD